MANEQNLRPGEHKLTVEEQKMGGRASGEARRRKRDLRLALETIMERDYTAKNGTAMTGAEAISLKLFEQAMKGNVKAFEMIRDTVGQKPVEKVMIADVDPDVISEVERAVFDGKTPSN